MFPLSVPTLMLWGNPNLSVLVTLCVPAKQIAFFPGALFAAKKLGSKQFADISQGVTRRLYNKGLRFRSTDIPLGNEAFATHSVLNGYRILPTARN